MLFKTKTWITAVLAAAVCVSATSCGLIRWNTGDGSVNDGGQTEDTAVAETNAETEAETNAPINVIEPTAGDKARMRLSELHSADLSGSSIIIVTVDDTTVCPISTDGDPVIASAVDSRYAVEEKYSTHIISRKYTSAELFEAAKESYNSDMYLADLLAVEMGEVGAYHAEGLLANLYSLPHTDFTAGYFNSSSVSAGTFRDGLYAVVGAACFNPDYLDCVYFNKALAEAAGAGDLYTLVTDGGWTWDDFAYLAKNAAASGVAAHGSPTELSEYIDTAASSMGISYVTNTKGSSPTVDYLDNSIADRAKGAVDKLASLMYSDEMLTKSKPDAVRGDFNMGNLLFSVDKLYYSEWIPDSPCEWGILPMPKYDASDEGYTTPIPGESPVFCALINTPGYETSGLILQALNATAYEYTLEAYKDECIDYRLRDSGSVRMLDIICDSATADFAHMYASGYSKLDDATYGAVFKAVTTRTTLDSAYRQQRGNANNQLSRSW